MKLKRFAALALTLAVALTLVTIPAGAANFTDLTGHWSKEDVEDVADRGLVKGYTDGSFRPDNKMTYCEALLFCSRATGLTASVKAQIAADWADEMEDLLPSDMLSWASEEMAVCLETGVISATELKALKDAGSLSKSITRETLVMYLTRAMQLEPLAESLTSYNTTFDDSTSISAALRPYVYLLNSYGIIKGNESNQFMPKGSLTRAEMATMLRRAVDFMADRGIVTELPAYTSNTWSGGVISAVNTGSDGATLLTLNSELSGVKSVTIPASAQIYKNNMLTTASSLKTGEYARVNFNTSGTATSVRLGGSLTTYTGTVSALTRDEITIASSGTTRRLPIDRFTEVQVGREVGNSSLLDLNAGYTEATCLVDEMGHLAGVRLIGGGQEEKGIITDVGSTSGGQTLQVSSFDGVITRYTVPTGTPVSVNGLVSALSSSQVGKYVSLRIDSDSGEITSVAVDTVSNYIQGAIKTVASTVSPRTITLSDVSTNRATTYEVADSALVTYEGKDIAFRNVKSGWFATLMVSGNQVVMLDTYPGSATTEGTISAILYGSDTTSIDVTLEDQSVVTYIIDMSDLPVIYRDDKESSIDKLRVGDEVVVTVRYNVVEEIEAVPQSANVSATITRITMESGGMTVDVKLSDGGSESYELGNSVSVIKGGKAVSIYELKPGDQISMAVVSGQVTTVEVEKSSENNTALTGTVIYTNTADQVVILQISDGSVVNVDASRAELREANGEIFYFNGLEKDDALQVFGAYSGGTFMATIIIRTS